MNDSGFMQQALFEAERAKELGEVPVGAIVTYRGGIIGRGCNQPILRHDPSAHAEMMAIRQAARHVGNYRLPECELFVTLEPCIMCAGAILHSRISRVVYAAKDPKTGAAGSVINPFADCRLNHQTQLLDGVMAEESSNLLKAFFRERRQAEKDRKRTVV